MQQHQRVSRMGTEGGVSITGQGHVDGVSGHCIGGGVSHGPNLPEHPAVASLAALYALPRGSCATGHCPPALWADGSQSPETRARPTPRPVSTTAPRHPLITAE